MACQAIQKGNSNHYGLQTLVLIRITWRELIKHIPRPDPQEFDIPHMLRPACCIQSTGTAWAGPQHPLQAPGLQLLEEEAYVRLHVGLQ